MWLVLSYSVTHAYHYTRDASRNPACAAAAAIVRTDGATQEIMENPNVRLRNFG